MTDRKRSYMVWLNMMRRCYLTDHHAYKDYGARGITVCPRWHDFDKFFEDMGTPPSGKWIDRTDNDGNYGPDNCHWVTPKQSAQNRRSNRGQRHGSAKLTARSVRLIRTLAARGYPQVQLASYFGVSPSQVSRIVRRRKWGWLK